MARAFEAAVLHVTTPTSTGTQDYTQSGFGTPAGAIILAARTTSLGSLTQNGAVSWGGISSDDDAICTFFFAQDNTSPSTSRSGGSDAVCIAIVDPDSPTPIEARANLTGGGLITDGVRLNWTTAGSTSYNFIVVLLGGSECEVATGYAVTTSSDVDVDVDFAPDFVLTNFMATTNQSQASHLQFVPGIAVRGGNGTGHSAACASRTNQTTTETSRGKFPSQVCVTHTDAVGSVDADCTISAFNSDGFTISPSVSHPTARIAYIAVRCTGTETVEVTEDDDLQTKAQPAGTVGYTWPTHRPVFVYSVYSANTAANFVSAGAAGIGVSDLRTSGCIQIGSQNNQNPSNTHCLTDTSFMHGYGHNGSELFDAEMDSQDSTGFTLDYVSIPNSNQRRWSAVSVEEQYSLRLTLPGTADLSGSMEADGAMSVDLDGAATLDADLDGAGELSIDLNGAATQSADLGGSAGLEVTMAGAAAQSASLEGTGSMEATLSGTADLSGDLDGTGDLEVTLAGAGALSADLGGAGDLAATLAGSGALSADLEGIGALAATLAGSGAFSGDLDGLGALVFTGAGTSTLLLFLEDAGGGPVVVALATRTCLAGSYAARTALQGAHTPRTALVGSHVPRVALTGSYAPRVALAGSYDLRTDLTGILETC